MLKKIENFSEEHPHVFGAIVATVTAPILYAITILFLCLGN